MRNLSSAHCLSVGNKRNELIFGFAVSSAEDPEKLLDTVVTEMQEDLIKMRQASAQVSETFLHSAIGEVFAKYRSAEPFSRWLQVMASQKQMEAKFRQAQNTAVRQQQKGVILKPINCVCQRIKCGSRICLFSSLPSRQPHLGTQIVFPLHMQGGGVPFSVICCCAWFTAQYVDIRGNHRLLHGWYACISPPCMHKSESHGH